MGRECFIKIGQKCVNMKSLMHANERCVSSSNGLDKALRR